MLIGYVRVSRADGSQRLDLQRDALAAAGVPSEAVYEDRASGRRDGRPGLEACLKALRSGDTLVVWKLDRLGRDLAHLVGLASGLVNRGVGLRVLTGQGAAIDTGTANGRTSVLGHDLCGRRRVHYSFRWRLRLGFMVAATAKGACMRSYSANRYSTRSRSAVKRFGR